MKLSDYVKDSELRVFNDRLKVRISKELSNNYNDGFYDVYLNNMNNYIKELDSLGIDNSHVYYIYIVPDDNYSELLNVPKIFDRGKGAGKPVECFDDDGFDTAYGTSQNLAYKREEEKYISRIVNNIHELAHLLHHNYYSKNQLLNEGFAETIPLYILDYEDKFIDHIKVLKNLTEDKIRSAKELLDEEKDRVFGKEEALENRSCSFRYSYISSYLFVRGIIESIEEKYSLSKIDSIKKFLNFMEKSETNNEELIYELADLIGISRSILLNSKTIQKKVLKNIK